jgi:hypothetical protein
MISSLKNKKKNENKSKNSKNKTYHNKEIGVSNQASLKRH